ncbi:MAG: complex I subunit 5 family protein [Candidatus Dormibacterales bacterium]
MSGLAPLSVAVPLGMAGVVAAMDLFLPRRAYELTATLTAALVAAACLVLLLQSGQHPLVYWFGGWRPLPHGVAIGIAFAVDPFGAGMAFLASSLTLAALVFSWRYFDAVGSFYDALMLVFMAAMVAFCLTGDLFDLFVFFELAGVAAFVLAGYKVEEKAPLQGAYNFGVTNTVAAFVILLGTALVYGRTGALNFAQIGNALRGQPEDGLLVVAFVLLMCGYFVKAAIVPFHFWLADAHAIAPTPVCILFSGVMVEMGLYAVWRVYWTMFGSTLGPHAGAVREILLVAGALTALVGAALALYQHHLKRLLAFTTIGHMGLFLIGTALMTRAAVAGAAIYVLGHAGVKAALFLTVGILAHRFGSFDEVRLRGMGRRLWPLGLVYALGGLALAGLPPFGTYLGSELIQGAAAAAGSRWVVAVFFVTELVVGSAVLRTAGTVFAGWGRPESGFYSSRVGDEKEPETNSPGRTPVTMVLPVAVLMAAGLAVGLLPGLAQAAAHAAAMFEDRAYYAGAVLGPPVALGTLPPVALPAPADLARSLGACAGAVLLALLVMHRRRLPVLLHGPARRVLAEPLDGLRRLHSGVVNDYVTWALTGLAAFGLAFALAVR